MHDRCKRSSMRMHPLMLPWLIKQASSCCSAITIDMYFSQLISFGSILPNVITSPSMVGCSTSHSPWLLQLQIKCRKLINIIYYNIMHQGNRINNNNIALYSYRCFILFFLFFSFLLANPCPYIYIKFVGV